MRRLPPWMLGGASTGEAAARNCSEPEAPKTKAEKRPRRNVKVKPKEKDFNQCSEEPKRVRRKMREEAKCSNGPEMIQSVMTNREDEDLTVDDLLSFAHEYVQSDQVQTSKEDESLSMSESMLVGDESNMSTSSQGGTRDPTAEDMLDLLMGPFFKKR